MKMNKNQIVMAAIGGVAAVGALAFGYLAFSAKTEGDETREEVASERSNMRRILAAPVPPTPLSLNGINRNKEAYAQWRGAAFDELSRGDFELNRAVTATSFQDTMRRDASALAKLPGGIEGKLVHDGFDFGFKSYIIDGSIPPEAELPVLRRQWAEVKAMVEILAASGAVELQGVEASAVAVQPEAPKEEPKRRGVGTKRPAKPAEPAKPTFEKMAYTLRFTARPAALVKVLNAFASSEHLMYVEDCAFFREKDMLGEMLGLGKKADEMAAGRGRRGRRGRREAEPTEGEGEETQRKGLVTDPVVEPPFVVTLKVTTIDFGTKGPAQEPAQEREVAE